MKEHPDSGLFEKYKEYIQDIEGQWGKPVEISNLSINIDIGQVQFSMSNSGITQQR